MTPFKVTTWHHRAVTPGIRIAYRTRASASLNSRKPDRMRSASSHARHPSVLPVFPRCFLKIAAACARRVTCSF